MIKNPERTAMRRAHGRSFGACVTMPARAPAIFASLAAAIVLAAPAAWGQNPPVPSPPPDCAQLCKEGFNTQLTDESQKKAFTACVVQNKCTSAGKSESAPKQNPLLGPFRF